MNAPTFLRCTSAIIALVISNPLWAAVPRNEYVALIAQARAGNYEPALNMLRQHAIEHPQDQQATYDHVLIASWANQNDEVVQAYDALQPPPAHPPAAVLEAVARACRDTQRWDAALTHYRQGQKLFPLQLSFRIGEVMTLADAGQHDQAIQQGQALVDAHPDNADARIALSYALGSNAEPYPALYETNHARVLAPQKNYVLQEHLSSLEKAGLADAALSMAQKNPGLVDAAHMRKLQADYLAELSRLAETPAREEGERYLLADRAIAEYDRLIPAWQALGEEAAPDVQRLQIDRLQALSIRNRNQDTVAAYEALISQGVVIPPYALRHVAAAYLEIRQPEQARNLYKQVEAADPSLQGNAAEKLSNQIGLYYSLIENEEFDEAHEVISAAQANHSAWRQIKGVPQRVPNDLHLYAEQTGALGLFYEDDTPGAQEQLEGMVNNAPRNVGLRTALANVYRSRGWPRLAEKQLKLAEALEPRAPEMEAGQGMTALDLQEWEQADILVQDLRARYPERPATQHLERQWDLYQKAELRVEVDGGIASDSPVSGDNDLSMKTVLYSAPISYNWRAFGGAGYAEGDFEEGSGHHRWALAGVEWRGRDLTAELEVSNHNYGYGAKTGARVSAAYDLNDQWQLGGSVALRSEATPLRALRNGVYANDANVYARWRHSDHREWSLALSSMHFSDGNNRWSTVLSGRERLYSAPRLQADLLLGVAASHNTHEEAAYFNPKSDLEILPSLRLTHTLYRHYETSLEHSLLLGAGLYAQEHYGSGAIGVVGYGMKYQYNDVFELGAMVTGASRPYDGKRERELRFMLEMSFRF